MALSTRIDYFGQSANAVIKQIDDDANAGFPVNVTAENERGDIIARDVSAAAQDAPSANFVCFAAGDVDLYLGAVTTYATSRISCLNGISIQTAKATPAAVTLSGEELQAGATVSSTIAVGSITLSPRHKAQNLMSSFTLSGTGCHLISCGLECKGNITRATKDGVTLAHDISGASIIISATVVQSGATAPTIEATEGWKITKPKSQKNPDSGYTEWTFETTKDLTSVEPA